MLHCCFFCVVCVSYFNWFIYFLIIYEITMIYLILEYANLTCQLPGTSSLRVLHPHVDPMHGIVKNDQGTASSLAGLVTYYDRTGIVRRRTIILES